MPGGGSRTIINQCPGFQNMSLTGERQTSNALAAAAETRKPTMHQIYMLGDSESKYQSTAV